MSKSQASDQTLSVSEARKQWSALINGVARNQTRVLIEKSGAPVAAVVSAEDLRRLEALDAERDRDFAILQEVGEAFKDVPLDELEHHLTSALATVRAGSVPGPSDTRHP